MTIEDCRWAVTDYQSALPRARGPLRKQVDILIGQAVGERIKIEQQQLNIRWTWCDDNAGHERYAEREEACLETLHEYEVWSDVIAEMCVAIEKQGTQCQTGM